MSNIAIRKDAAQRMMSVFSLLQGICNGIDCTDNNAERGAEGELFNGCQKDQIHDSGAFSDRCQRRSALSNLSPLLILSQPRSHQVDNSLGVFTFIVPFLHFLFKGLSFTYFLEQVY